MRFDIFLYTSLLTVGALSHSLPAIAGSAQSDGSINEGAKSAKMVQMAGAGINAAAAAYFAAKCSSQNAYACMAAASAATQAASMLTSAQGSQESASASQYDPGVYNPTGTPLPGGVTPGKIGDVAGSGDRGSDALIRAEKSKVTRILNDLKNKGYGVSPDGKSITTPTGQSVASSALSSAEGMKSIGMSDQQISEMMAAQKSIAAQAKDKFAKSKIDVDEGGGGGSRKAASDANEGAGPNFNSLFADKEKKKAAANVSGLSKQFGDSRIGVPQDNIFDMVRRQYVKQDGAQSFIQNQPRPLSKRVR